MRKLLFILSLLVLASCGGGGGGSNHDDVKVEGVRISKQYDQGWIAENSAKFSEMELTLEYEYIDEDGKQAYKVATGGDVFWTITEGGEYAQVTKRDSSRLGDLKALKACPEDNRECVTVSVEFRTGKRSYFADMPIVVKPTDDNLLPSADIGVSTVMVNGISMAANETQDSSGNLVGITVEGGALVTLSGYESIDYDGNINGYSWQVGDLESSDKSQPEITLTTPVILSETTYVIELSVYDNSSKGGIGKKQIKLTVNPKIFPEIELKIDKEYEQSWIAVDSDSYNQMELALSYRPEGEDQYRNVVSGDVYWTITEGAEYASITLSQTDGRSAELQAIKACPENNRECVTVSGKIELASGAVYLIEESFVVKPTEENLLPDAVITVGGQRFDENIITLQGGSAIKLGSSGSVDYDGYITGYSWDVPDAISITDNHQSEITLITPDGFNVEKNYTVSLNVTDAEGAVGKRDIELVIKPVLPVARASVSTENGNAGDTITLIGSNSSFADGTITDYQWKQAAGTATEYITAITNSENGDVEITLPELTAADEKDGKKLDFELTVTNNLGKTDTATVAVTVLPESANKAPVLTVTFDAQTVTTSEGQLPSANEKTTVCSTATATDSDTGMKSISWILPEGFQLQSGEQEKSIDDKAAEMTSTICYIVPTQPITKTEENADSVSNRKEYQIYATAKDAHEEAEKIQTTQVNKGIAIVPVNAAPKIQLNVTEEESSITITATVTDPDPVQTGENDPDGKIITLNWQQTAGAEVQTEPDSSLEAKLNKNSLTTSIRLLKPIKKQPNSYAFSVTVKDNEGEETTATTEELQLENGLGFNGIDLTPNSLRITEKELDNNQWQLNWEQSNNVHQYIIYWRTNKAGETEYSNSRVFLIGNAETDANTEQNYTITPAEEDKNTTYYYKIRAVYPGYEIDNISQISELDADSENSISRDSNEVTYLPVPQNVYVNDDLKKIELKWNAVAEADSYRIDCKMTDNQGEIDCEAICNESGTDTVTGTTCTHEQNIVTNVFDEESRTVKSTRYDYRVIPLKDNNIGRYTDKNEIYARVGEVADISPAPEPASGNMYFQYKGDIYNIDINSGDVDLIRKLDPQKPVSKWEAKNVPEGIEGFDYSVVDSENEKLYVCNESILSSLDLDNYSTGWEINEISGLNCDWIYGVDLEIHNNHLIVLSESTMQFIDLESKTLIMVMDYSEEMQAEGVKFEKLIRVNGDLLVVRSRPSEDNGYRSGEFYTINLDELISDAKAGQNSSFEFFASLPNDICSDNSYFAIVTDGNDYLYYRGQTIVDGSCSLGIPIFQTLDLGDLEWGHRSKASESEFERNNFKIFYNESKILIMGDSTLRFSYEVLEITDGVESNWNIVNDVFGARVGLEPVVYQEEIILVGGVEGIFSPIPDSGRFTNVYSPTIGSWVDLQARNYGLGDGDFYSFEYNNRVVVFENSQPVETYVPNAWSVDSDLGQYTLDGCSVKVGKYIYRFGKEDVGEDYGGGLRVEYYDSDSGWVLLDEQYNSPSLASANPYDYSCISVENKVYFFVGDVGNGGFDIYVFDVKTKQWVVKTVQEELFPSSFSVVGFIWPSPYKVYYELLKTKISIHGESIVFPVSEDNGEGASIQVLKAYHIPTGEVRSFNELPISGHGSKVGFSMVVYKGGLYLFGGTRAEFFTPANLVSVVY